MAKKETKSSSVKIYSTATCPWCARAKEYFKEHGVKYTELRVDTNAKAREEMIEKSGQLGVPVIDINGKIIVGFDVDAINEALSM